MFRILVILLSLFCFPPRLNAETAQAQADQEIAEEKSSSDSFSWDFAQVRSGQIVKHEFLIRNKTDKILKIKDVSTSCGCTASSVKEKAIQPHGSTGLEVIFDSKGYSGNVQQYVYVTTDDPQNEIQKFTIKANVVK